MTITIDERHLLALLRECLPVLEFAVGGCDCEDVTARVRFVLELAGQIRTSWNRMKSPWRKGNRLARCSSPPVSRPCRMRSKTVMSSMTIWLREPELEAEGSASANYVAATGSTTTWKTKFVSNAERR